jgi:toxin ParE1/3/4
VEHRVVFAPEAQDDLRKIYLFIAEQAGDARAMAYLERIEAYCAGFATFPQRGMRRDDLLPGLRIVGFEQRISIAFHVTAGVVTLDRVFYGGRDFAALLSQVDLP